LKSSVKGEILSSQQVLFLKRRMEKLRKKETPEKRGGGRYRTAGGA